MANSHVTSTMNKSIKLLLTLPFILVFLSFNNTLSSQSITKYGYPEHFIGGALLSGTVSYLVYKKTENKTKAWLVGFGASLVAGGLKEAVDPEVFGGTRNVRDFYYTALGGALGASVILPLGRRKKKDSLSRVSELVW